MKVNTMNLKNKVAVAATSVITLVAIVLASPALASKGAHKATIKPTASASATATPLPTPPNFGMGDRGHGKGKGHGPRGPMTPITKTVTVDVPETGTFALLVTEVAPANVPTPPAGAPARPDHSFTVAVTGTGSQTITLNLPHPGDYKVSLISVVSTQSIAATK